jgi:hypothetical protein
MEIKMFTKDIYRQYFEEIHRKQREMIIMLHQGLDNISEERMQKALAWHMKREIRLAVMIKKLVRVLSSESEVEDDQVSQPAQAWPEQVSL